MEKHTEVCGKAHLGWCENTPEGVTLNLVLTHTKNMVLLYAIYKGVPDGTNVEHYIWCALHALLFFNIVLFRVNLNGVWNTRYSGTSLPRKCFYQAP